MKHIFRAVIVAGPQKQIPERLIFEIVLHQLYQPGMRVDDASDECGIRFSVSDIEEQLLVSLNSFRIQM